MKSIRDSKTFCIFPGFIETFLADTIEKIVTANNVTRQESKIGTEKDKPKNSIVFGKASITHTPLFIPNKKLTISTYRMHCLNGDYCQISWQ